MPGREFETVLERPLPNASFRKPALKQTKYSTKVKSIDECIYTALDSPFATADAQVHFQIMEQFLDETLSAAMAYAVNKSIAPFTQHIHKINQYRRLKQMAAIKQFMLHRQSQQRSQNRYYPGCMAPINKIHVQDTRVDEIVYDMVTQCGDTQHCQPWRKKVLRQVTDIYYSCCTWEKRRLIIYKLYLLTQPEQNERVLGENLRKFMVSRVIQYRKQIGGLIKKELPEDEAAIWSFRW